MRVADRRGATYSQGRIWAEAAGSSGLFEVPSATVQDADGFDRDLRVAVAAESERSIEPAQPASTFLSLRDKRRGPEGLSEHYL